MNATPGYDEVTGRGTPIANLLVKDLISAEPLGPPASPLPISPVLPTPVNADAKQSATTQGTTTIQPLVSLSGKALATGPKEPRSRAFAALPVRRSTRLALEVADELADELLAAIYGKPTA